MTQKQLRTLKRLFREYRKASMQDYKVWKFEVLMAYLQAVLEGLNK